MLGAETPLATRSAAALMRKLGSGGGRRPPAGPPSAAGSSSTSTGTTSAYSASASASSTTSGASAASAAASSPLQDISFWQWLAYEHQWGHGLAWQRAARPSQHVVNFLSVPYTLEPFLSFGSTTCLYLFAFQFTSLPLRCVSALFALATALAAAAAALAARLGSALFLGGSGSGRSGGSSGGAGVIGANGGGKSGGAGSASAGKGVAAGGGRGAKHGTPPQAPPRPAPTPQTQPPPPSQQPVSSLPLLLPHVFTRAHTYDLLKALVIVLSVLALGWVQVSRVYHYIRGEAVIKLYVVVSILDVFDRLATSLGADVMDALYRTTRDHFQLPGIAGGDVGSAASGGVVSPASVPASVSGASLLLQSSASTSVSTIVATPSLSSSASSSSLASLTFAPVRSPPGAGGTRAQPADGEAPLVTAGAAALRLLFHFLVAVAYVVAHSLILFVQIVCLNVAINGKNNALLTLLVSNNFVELKSSVFRKFEAETLFQVACADAVERFQLALFLVLIALQEFTSLEALRALVPVLLVIFLCEVVVDHIKHSFISKFNRLHADLYQTFSAILAHDLLSARHRMRTSLDPTHTCAKRIGLATLPLTVVVVRMVLLKLEGMTHALGGSAAAAAAAAAAAMPVPQGLALPSGAVAGGASMLPRTSLDAPFGLLAYVLLFCCMLAFKTGLGMLLQAHAARVIVDQRTKGSSSAGAASVVAATVGKDAPMSPLPTRDEGNPLRSSGAVPRFALPPPLPLNARRPSRPGPPSSPHNHS